MNSTFNSNFSDLTVLKGDKGDKGDKGEQGADGADGVGIQSVVQTTTSAEDGGTNVITVTKTDGSTSTFEVRNGSKGSDGVPGADGKDGADGAKGEKGEAGTVEITGATGLAAGSAPTVTEAADSTAQARKYTLGIPAGEKGADGAKGDKGDKGETGAKGDKGEQGAKGDTGADGKSAYQYAKDGGYTGTEEEFAAKLAQEMPDKLPNPNALTFTGAVNETYDGSAPVSVEIPSGGGNKGWTLLYDGDITIEEAVTRITDSLLVPCDGMVDFIGHIKWTANANTENGNDNVSIRVGKAYMDYGRIGDTSTARSAIFQATVTSIRTYWGRADTGGNSLEFNLSNMQYGFTDNVKYPDYENVTIELFSKTYAGTITLQLYGR